MKETHSRHTVSRRLGTCGTSSSPCRTLHIIIKALLGDEDKWSSTSPVSTPKDIDALQRALKACRCSSECLCSESRSRNPERDGESGYLFSVVDEDDKNLMGDDVEEYEEEEMAYRGKMRLLEENIAVLQDTQYRVLIARLDEYRIV